MIDDLQYGKTIVYLLLLIISKVCDSLDHRTLLSKIISLGITGLTLSWFKSFLQERKEIVELRQLIDGTS